MSLMCEADVGSYGAGAPGAGRGSSGTARPGIPESTGAETAVPRTARQGKAPVEALGERTPERNQGSGEGWKAIRACSSTCDAPRPPHAPWRAGRRRHCVAFLPVLPLGLVVGGSAAR